MFLLEAYVRVRNGSSPFQVIAKRWDLIKDYYQARENEGSTPTNKGLGSASLV